jgi:SAM-dependent methyltransferase
MIGDLVTRQCPVCRSGAGEFLLEKPGVRVERCPACGMVYANPVPRPLVNGEFYDASSAYYLSPEKLGADYAVSRFMRELRIFRRFCVKGRVLDVGCSSGAFLWNLQRAYPGDYEALGMDASGAPLDYAEGQGVPVLRGDFLNAKLADASFDAIVFWATLEHLGSPRDFLDRACNLLKPGGLVFALVPNFASLATRVLGRRYRYIYEQHLNYFDRRTLAMLLSGMEVKEIISTHFNPVVIWKDLRGGAREVSGEERAQLLQRTTQYKESPWLAPARWGYQLIELGLGKLFLADNITIVAQKKRP